MAFARQVGQERQREWDEIRPERAKGPERTDVDALRVVHECSTTVCSVA